MLLFILALVSFSALNVLANPIRPSKHKWYSPNPPHIGMPQVNPRDIDVQEVSHLATCQPDELYNFLTDDKTIKEAREFCKIYIAFTILTKTTTTPTFTNTVQVNTVGQVLNFISASDTAIAGISTTDASPTTTGVNARLRPRQAPPPPTRAAGYPGLRLSSVCNCLVEPSTVITTQTDIAPPVYSTKFVTVRPTPFLPTIPSTPWMSSNTTANPSGYLPSAGTGTGTAVSAGTTSYTQSGWLGWNGTSNHTAYQGTAGTGGVAGSTGTISLNLNATVTPAASPASNDTSESTSVWQGWNGTSTISQIGTGTAASTGTAVSTGTWQGWNGTNTTPNDFGTGTAGSAGTAMSTGTAWPGWNGTTTENQVGTGTAGSAGTAISTGTAWLGWNGTSTENQFGTGTAGSIETAISTSTEAILTTATGWAGWNGTNVTTSAPMGSGTAVPSPTSWGGWNGSAITTIPLVGTGTAEPSSASWIGWNGTATTENELTGSGSSFPLPTTTDLTFNVTAVTTTAFSGTNPTGSSSPTGTSNVTTPNAIPLAEYCKQPFIRGTGTFLARYQVRCGYSYSNLTPARVDSRNSFTDCQHSCDTDSRCYAFSYRLAGVAANCFIYSNYPLPPGRPDSLFDSGSYVVGSNNGLRR